MKLQGRNKGESPKKAKKYDYFNWLSYFNLDAWCLYETWGDDSLGVMDVMAKRFKASLYF